MYCAESNMFLTTQTGTTKNEVLNRPAIVICSYLLGPVCFAEKTSRNTVPADLLWEKNIISVKKTSWKVHIIREANKGHVVWSVLYPNKRSCGDGNGINRVQAWDPPTVYTWWCMRRRLAPNIGGMQHTDTVPVISWAGAFEMIAKVKAED